MEVIRMQTNIFLLIEFDHMVDEKIVSSAQHVCIIQKGIISLINNTVEFNWKSMSA